MRQLRPLPPALCPGRPSKAHPPVVRTLWAAKIQDPLSERDLRTLGGKPPGRLKTRRYLY